jgi:hypothetical protein
MDLFWRRARRTRKEMRTRQREADQIRKQREDDLAKLRAEAQSALLLKAKAALDDNKIKLFTSLSDKAFELANVGPAVDDGNIDRSPDDVVTPHEKLLDAWRVFTTILLVIALGLIIGVVLLNSTAAKSGTPYVSLLSGLAGIALGWMFASAANPNAAKRSAKRIRVPDVQPVSSSSEPSASAGPGTGAGSG